MNKKKKLTAIEGLVIISIILIVVTNLLIIGTKEKNEEILFIMESENMLSNKDYFEIERDSERIKSKLEYLGYDNVSVVVEKGDYYFDAKILAKTNSGKHLEYNYGEWNMK